MESADVSKSQDLKKGWSKVLDCQSNEQLGWGGQTTIDLLVSRQSAERGYRPKTRRKTKEDGHLL